MSNEWIEWKWTPEKPYPETLDTMVYTRHDDGHVFDGGSEQESVGWWHEDEAAESSWNPEVLGSITHYKLA